MSILKAPASSLLIEVLFSRPWARILILLSSLCAAFFGLLAPYFQKEFIDGLLGNQSRLVHLIDTHQPLLLIGTAFLCLLTAQAFAQITNYLGYYEALIMQRKLSDRLYDKMLSLRTDTMSQRPVGEVVSIYATEVPGSTVFLEQTLPSGAATLFPLILAPFALSMIFQVPLWPTIGTIIFVTLVNTYLALKQSTYFFNYKHLGAKRIGLVNEWIQNMRTLRILGWLSFFERQIFSVREVETKNRVQMVTNGQTMNAISSSVTFGLNVVTLGTLMLMSKERLTPGEIMALLWILTIFLTRPFRQMPWFFTMGFDSWTSLKRLHDFLQTKNTEPDTPDVAAEEKDPSPTEALAVTGLNLSIDGKKILDDIEFDIKPGEFVAIVGEVGSGKSMLLLSLLKETSAQFKKYKILGRDALKMTADQIRKKFSFVPQEGFIMSASLRDNVAFLYDTPEESDLAILESLKLAQFELTKEDVTQGLETEIGERGVNLSGGQKQRVSLARVHFLNASIILLDDCLSALDVNTEEKLLDSLLKGAWAKKTRILVTHRLSVLPKVDRIFVMADGKIVRIGTYEEILRDKSGYLTRVQERGTDV
jgi:ATP-binding cassette subfamily B multidrug efflux pump